ncbi:MAG: carboxypeptidase regulatory-like domain-containing protein, partial [Acidimicrobiia bacterium]
MRKIVVLFATALACTGLALAASTSIAPPAHAADGSISGTVTGRATGSPVAGVGVTIYWSTSDGSTAPAGFQSRFLTSAANGTFSAAVPAGRYAISVNVPASVPYAGFINNAYPLPGGAILVADGQSVSNVAILLDAGGTITGTVRDEAGNPVVGATVWPGSSVNAASTNASGVYTLPHQPVGALAITVSPPSGTNLVGYRSTDTVQVTDGGTVVRDVVLHPGAILIGTVTGPSGPITSGAVLVEGAANTFIRPDGTFSISSIPPGRYSIRVIGPTNLTEVWYPNVSSANSAVAVQFTANQTVTWNPVLSAAATLSGNVTVAGGGSVVGNNLLVTQGGRTVTTSYIDGAGNYNVGRIAPGIYTVKAREASAQLTVSAPTAYRVDLTVAPTGSITGRVVGPNGAAANTSVFAEPTVGGSPVAALTAADGTFTITGLVAGQYVVRTGASSPGGYGYSNPAGLELTYHPNAPGRGGATPVAVTAGGVTSGVNITARAGAAISVAISIDDGASVTGMYAIAVPVGGVGINSSNRASGSSAGHLRFDGLTPGRYRIFVSYALDPAGPQTYLDAVPPQFLRSASGAPVEIQVAAGQTTSVTGTVERGSILTGAVQMTDGRALVEDVEIVNTTTGLLRGTTPLSPAGANGANWSLRTLAGSYQVYARTSAGRADPSWWTGPGTSTTSPTSRGTFVMPAGGGSIGLTPVQYSQLTPGTIAGVVRSSSGTPVSGALVTMDYFEPGETRYAVTDGNGHYAFTEVLPGAGTVYVLPPPGSGLYSADEGDGQSPPPQAVIVGPGATTTVDRVLPTIAEATATTTPPPPPPVVLPGVVTPAGGLTGTSPDRVLDTGNTTDRVCAGTTRKLQVTGRNGIPATGVDSVALNLTIDQPTESGYVTIWPANQNQPGTSTIN